MKTKFGLGIATAFATFFLSVGQAFAVTPTIFNACVDNNGGIRILGINQYGFPTTPCQAYETPISLQAATPATRFVTHQYDLVLAKGSGKTIRGSRADCATGEQVTGGGAGETNGGITYYGVTAEPFAKVVASMPYFGVPNAPPTGWVAWFQTDLTNSNNDISVSIWVVCAKP